MKIVFYTIISIICIIFMFSISCKHEETININSIDKVQNPHNLPLQYFFYHTGNTFESEITIGIWMFKSNYIANWLAKKVDGEEVYEPINIIWVDYLSETDIEAKENIKDFLENNSFKTRDGSSTGYFTFVGESSQLKKISQHPTDKTWSDGKSVADNNHGRIFTKRDNTGNAFYTLGAFSREKGISHKFISFNAARNALHPSGSWVYDGMNKTIPNIYQPGVQSDFSTKDHDGVYIFVLYP